MKPGQSGTPDVLWAAHEQDRLCCAKFEQHERCGPRYTPVHELCSPTFKYKFGAMQVWQAEVLMPKADCAWFQLGHTTAHENGNRVNERQEI